MNDPNIVDLSCDVWECYCTNCGRTTANVKWKSTDPDPQCPACGSKSVRMKPRS